MTTRRLSAALISAATLAVPAQAHAATMYDSSVLDARPLTYLRMEETSGTTALDASPNGRHGIYAGAVLGAAGPFPSAGNAVTLAGGATVAAQVEQTSGSVELWVNPNRLRRGEQAGYVAHGDPGGNGWALGVGAKRKLAFVSGGHSTTLRVTVPNSAWTMVAATWVGDKVKVFVNGSLAKEALRPGAAPTSSNAQLMLGDTGAGAFGGAFAGRLDEVAVFAEALTAAQIKGHYAAARLPINTASPTISGTLKVGETLTAQAGIWTDATSAAEYRWQSCDAAGDDCADIEGATGSTYVLGAADAGTTLQVIETVSNSFGATSAVSEPTGVVEAPASDGNSNDPGSVTTNPGTDITVPGIATSTPGTSTTLGMGSPSAAGAGPANAIAGVATAGRPACLRVVAAKRTLRLRALGVLRLTTGRNGCVGTGAPLRLSFKASKGKPVRSLQYRLDGKRLRTAPKARTVTLAAGKLRPGRHVLSLRVIPRDGKTRTLTVSIRAIAR